VLDVGSDCGESGITIPRSRHALAGHGRATSSMSSSTRLPRQQPGHAQRLSRAAPSGAPAAGDGRPSGPQELNGGQGACQARVLLHMQRLLRRLGHQVADGVLATSLMARILAPGTTFPSLTRSGLGDDSHSPARSRLPGPACFVRSKNHSKSRVWEAAQLAHQRPTWRTLGPGTAPPPCVQAMAHHMP
jgi:hypothetical protein